MPVVGCVGLCDVINVKKIVVCFLAWKLTLMLKTIVMLLRVGSSFFFLTLNTSHKPHLQEMLPMWHPCHTWDFGRHTMCKVVSLKIPCPQWLRLHGLISSELGLRTWDPV